MLAISFKVKTIFVGLKLPPLFSGILVSRGQKKLFQNFWQFFLFFWVIFVEFFGKPASVTLQTWPIFPVFDQYFSAT